MEKFKIVICVFFICIFSSVLSAQIRWQSTSVTPNTDNQRFDDVFFLNENVGWAANGFYAKVFKTTDGGVNWTKQFDENDIGTDLYLRNITFLNENIGFLGTLNDKIYKTENGGTTWTEITNISPFPKAICGFDTVGTTTVYGCGAFFEPAYIIKSIDSGATWTNTDMSTLATALVEIKFINENVGYAAGKNDVGAIILKTTDAGATWTEIYNSGIAGEYAWKLQVFPDTDVIFSSIQSVSPNPGKLLKTFDAGATFTTVDAPVTDVQAVGFISETQGWMGGYDAEFYETTDGGTTWTDLGVGGNLNRVFVIDANTVYAAGTTIYKYTSETLNVDDVAISDTKSIKINLKENPVEDFLNFSIDFSGDDNMLIELYDVQGKLIKQLFRDNIVNGSKEYKYDVKSLSAGIYILNFHNNSGRRSVKFIKK